MKLQIYNRLIIIVLNYLALSFLEEYKRRIFCKHKSKVFQKKQWHIHPKKLQIWFFCYYFIILSQPLGSFCTIPHYPRSYNTVDRPKWKFSDMSNLDPCQYAQVDDIFSWKLPCNTCICLWSTTFDFRSISFTASQQIDASFFTFPLNLPSRT